MVSNILGNYLKEIRLKKDLSQIKLGKILNTTVQSISESELGKRVPRKEKLEKWLSMAGGLHIGEVRESTSTEIEIPLLPAFPAGDPKQVFNDTEIENIQCPGFFFKSRQKSRLIAFPLTGDSMDKVLPDGCIIFAERYVGDRPRDGSICLFYSRTDDEFAVKELIYTKKKNTVILNPLSFNAKYKPRPYLLSELEIVAIVFSYLMPKIR